MRVRPPRGCSYTTFSPAGGTSAAVIAPGTATPAASDHGVLARESPLRKGGGRSTAHPSPSNRPLRPKPMAASRLQPRPLLACSSLGNVSERTTTRPPAPPDSTTTLEWRLYQVTTVFQRLWRGDPPPAHSSLPAPRRLLPRVPRRRGGPGAVISAGNTRPTSPPRLMGRRRRWRGGRRTPRCGAGGDLHGSAGSLRQCCAQGRSSIQGSHSAVILEAGSMTSVFFLVKGLSRACQGLHNPFQGRPGRLNQHQILDEYRT